MSDDTRMKKLQNLALLKREQRNVVSRPARHTFGRLGDSGILSTSPYLYPYFTVYKGRGLGVGLCKVLSFCSYSMTKLRKNRETPTNVMHLLTVILN